MARHIATIPLASAEPGKMFALVHPGGLLATSATILHLGVKGVQDVEVRLLVSRYDTKATLGSLIGSCPLTDNAASGKLEVRTGSVTWPVGTPALSVPDRCCSRGLCQGITLFDDKEFTLAPNHTIVVETLDPIPSAATYPLTFVLIWEE